MRSWRLLSGRNTATATSRPLPSGSAVRGGMTAYKVTHKAQGLAFYVLSESASDALETVVLRFGDAESSSAWQAVVKRPEFPMKRGVIVDETGHAIESFKPGSLHLPQRASDPTHHTRGRPRARALRSARKNCYKRSSIKRLSLQRSMTLPREAAHVLPLDRLRPSCR